MDLTRQVRYRGFDLNLIQFDPVTNDMVGIEITRASYHAVQGVGYDEKKAFADGFDAGDVFLGKRAIALSGNVYGRTRAEAFTYLTNLIDILTPTDAYDADPSNKGFLPFDFYTPTTRRATGADPDHPTQFPNGLMHQVIYARPVAQPSIDFTSDGSGGADSGALAIPWSAVLEARQPNILNYDDTTIDMKEVVGGSGTARNRGNRTATLDIRLRIPPRFKGRNVGRWTLKGFGTHMYFSIPSTDKQLILRYSSLHKVVELQSGSKTPVLRMDLLHFYDGFDHPYMPPGERSYHWSTSHGTGKKPRSGSYIRFRDTWA